MKKLSLHLGVFVLFVSGLGAQIPDTPAGRQFFAWHKAQDSGDRAIIQEFLDKNMPWGRVEQELAFHNQTRGFDVRKVEESSETRLVVLAQTRNLSRFCRITFGVASAEPHKVTGLMVQPVESPPELTPPTMTASEDAIARNGAPFRQFSAWLDAFNTGDRKIIGHFLETTFPSMNLDGHMSFRQRTGPLELRQLEHATATTITGLVQERDSDQFARFDIEVEVAEPHRIIHGDVRAIQRPKNFPVPVMNAAEIVNALGVKLEKDAAEDRFAGAVILAKGGNVLFSGAYGLADRETKVLNRLDTRFRIGSMNKMFTAVSILQLVQNGKISLSDPLGKYIPDYPNREVATKVTIHQLLTHTGGTGDIFGPEYDAHRLELRTLSDYVALYGKRAPMFEPGTAWGYSNYGMLLLGVVIEKVSGQSYYEYVSEHIYSPADMTFSGSEPENQEVSGRSVGYMRDQAGAWTPNTITLPYRGTSAGGGYSTVGDLVKFANALMGHKLLNAEFTDLLITGKTGPGGAHTYAYGFEDGRRDGLGAVGHGGGAPGMNGDLRIYPSSGYIVAVLSNIDPPAAQKISTFLDLRLEGQIRAK